MRFVHFLIFKILVKQIADFYWFWVPCRIRTLATWVPCRIRTLATWVPCRIRTLATWVSCRIRTLATWVSCRIRTLATWDFNVFPSHKLTIRIRILCALVSVWHKVCPWWRYDDIDFSLASVGKAKIIWRNQRRWHHICLLLRKKIVLKADEILFS